MNKEEKNITIIKKIIHIDMDAFYASVEQRDNPDLRGKPIAVGGSSKRGVVATASYEARKYGVHSAMPSQLALKKCPDLIFVKPRFDVYRKISDQIRQILFEYTDLVEPLSLDEAYLDVTSNKKNMPSATLIAREIKKNIRDKTGLTASAGISVNKFLAKIASDVNKPDGLFVIPPEKTVSFIEKLPVEKFFGIGKVTAEKMHQMGIWYGLDLKKYSLKELIKHFGKAGKYYYNIVHGVDTREVNTHRIRKSLGAEITFPEDLTDMDSVREELEKFLDILSGRMRRTATKGKTLTLKIKYADFKQITRSKTSQEWISNSSRIRIIYEELLKPIEIRNGIRLLGLTLSNLNHESSVSNTDTDSRQLTLDL